MERPTVPSRLRGAQNLNIIIIIIVVVVTVVLHYTDYQQYTSNMLQCQCYITHAVQAPFMD
jgi:hypothetical protein